MGGGLCCGGLDVALWGEFGVLWVRLGQIHCCSSVYGGRVRMPLQWRLTVGLLSAYYYYCRHLLRYIVSGFGLVAR